MATHYIETSIPSFYHEIRPEPTMVARREWTQRWWKLVSSTGRIVTSVAVLNELQRGIFPSREDAIQLVDSLDLLEINGAVLEIVQAYIAHQLMPADPLGDALHLAIAS